MAKIVVSMSGGVDSSVAASLLKKRGYKVIGVTIEVWGGDANQLAEVCSLNRGRRPVSISCLESVPVFGGKATSILIRKAS